MAAIPILNKGRFFDALEMIQKNIEYDSTGRELYVGYAAPGAADDDASWLIFKFSYDDASLVTSKRFADGSVEFDKVWDDRNAYAF